MKFKKGMFLFAREKKTDSQGFTFIELLVGLGIFSLIALTLYATFANGIQLNRKSQNLEAIYRDARWSLERLALDLENTVPYHYPVGSGDIFKTVVEASTAQNVEVITGEFGVRIGADSQPVSFFGDKASISFVVPSGAGLKKVRYFSKAPDREEIYRTIMGVSASRKSSIVARYEEEMNIHFLVREETPFSSSETFDSDREVEEEVLSRFVQEESLKFFYAAKGEGDEIAWVDQWETGTYPLAVRIEMILKNPHASQQALTIQKDIFIPLGSWGGIASLNGQLLQEEN